MAKFGVVTSESCTDFVLFLLVSIEYCKLKYYCNAIRVVFHQTSALPYKCCKNYSLIVDVSCFVRKYHLLRFLIGRGESRCSHTIHVLILKHSFAKYTRTQQS